MLLKTIELINRIIEKKITEMTTTKPTLFSEIENLIKELNPETISSERKAVLQPLSEFIQSKVSNNEEIRINFICTHNSSGLLYTSRCV